MSNPIILWVVARLEEPSTWAGVAALVGSMSFLPNASVEAQVVSAVGVAIAGALAVVFPEKK
jgi:hypothetical protein